MLFASCHLLTAVRLIIVLGFDPLRISRETVMKAERLEWPDGGACLQWTSLGNETGFYIS
jgi:hypothetical protein